MGDLEVDFYFIADEKLYDWGLRASTLLKANDQLIEEAKLLESPPVVLSKGPPSNSTVTHAPKGYLMGGLVGKEAVLAKRMAKGREEAG